MDDQKESTQPESESGHSRLEAERVRWEIDKLDAKRRLLEEVMRLVRHDNAINAEVTRVVESMASFAQNDPNAFWNERSTSGSPAARLQFPFPPPSFPFPFPPIPPLPFPPFPIPLPIPMPGDVFGQIVDLIKAEKAMIKDLIKDILT
ncbi:MAG: hypothetical protein M3P06_14495 [Acidobacteriota bacterium]|nr:hypothetical protein [Acidobacteriota bacterium]